MRGLRLFILIETLDDIPPNVWVVLPSSPSALTLFLVLPPPSILPQPVMVRLVDLGEYLKV